MLQSAPCHWSLIIIAMNRAMNYLIFVLLLLCLPLHAQFDATSVDFDTQTITIALTQEPPQLNSMKATDQVSTFILPHIMEGLVRYDRRGNVIPGVATRWEVNAHGATFWLRQNALWSDGKPVTAHDFVFAWQNALAPRTASEYAFILYPIKNGEAISAGKLDPQQLRVTAIDDWTLKIEFERPTGYFLKLTAFTTYFPVREDFFNTRGDIYAADVSDLLFNGPFILTEWVHSASLKMVKNEHYWDKDQIHLNEIDAAYITEDSRARLNLFIDGKIVHTRLDGETYKDALTQRLRIRSFTTGSVFFIEYNHRPERPTSHINIRKAIQHVFDPDEFVNKVLATPGNLQGRSLFPVWLQGVEGKFRQEYIAPEAELNLAKAKKLINKAKQELGVEQIPPLILLSGNTPTATKQAEYMQGLLKARLDLDIKIDKQTFKQRLAKMTSGDFDMVLAGWGPDFDDVMTFGDLFASWNLNNRGRYNNPEYDDLVRLAMNSIDAQVRMDAMGKMQQILFDDAVVLPQYEQGVIYLMHPKIRGVVRRVVGPDPDYTKARVIK
ncbi:MAG TPA: peptide ABC transporter substrate-binding protein [Gammaproteobacteria bacterium]|nr:peptide ABC transporter substrate-binding protein [Gammaproteobacteria bacterium]HIL97604.1 peptide ABC transporter substrate-binding protein [Pseudomonadales bacterium]